MSPSLRCRAHRSAAITCPSGHKVVNGVQTHRLTLLWPLNSFGFSSQKIAHLCLKISIKTKPASVAAVKELQAACTQSPVQGLKLSWTSSSLIDHCCTDHMTLTSDLDFVLHQGLLQTPRSSHETPTKLPGTAYGRRLLRHWSSSVVLVEEALIWMEIGV